MGRNIFNVGEAVLTVVRVVTETINSQIETGLLKTANVEVLVQN